MCSLDEAFTTAFSEDQESRVQEKRNNKRRKRREVLPPEPAVIEPDRPAHRPLPPAELLGGKPETFTSSSSESAMLNALDVAPSSYFPNPSSDINDENAYVLEPDWTKAFNNTSIPDWLNERMPQRDAESPLTPSPWLDGAATLWQSVPTTQKPQSVQQSSATRLDEMQQRLERMFAKMEELETTRSESNHIEIILFVLGGIFILLIVDLLVKQGTQASFMLAAAGGHAIHGGSMFLKTLGGGL